MADDPLAQAVARMEDAIARCEGVALAFTKLKHAIAQQSAALHAAREDAGRLDWLEASARQHKESHEADIKVEHHDVPSVEQTGFYVRQWGAVPLDGDGDEDYSRRFYRSTFCGDSLRAAIDAARAANQEGT